MGPSSFIPIEEYWQSMPSCSKVNTMSSSGLSMHGDPVSDSVSGGTISVPANVQADLVSVNVGAASGRASTWADPVTAKVGAAISQTVCFRERLLPRFFTEGVLSVSPLLGEAVGAASTPLWQPLFTLCT